MQKIVHYLFVGFCILLTATIVSGANSPEGKWTSTFGEIEIKVKDGIYSGKYTYDNGIIQRARLNGQILSGEWVESPKNKQKRVGRFRWTFTKDFTSFSGTWGYSTSNTDGGAWKGNRITQQTPSQNTCDCSQFTGKCGGYYCIRPDTGERINYGLPSGTCASRCCGSTTYARKYVEAKTWYNKQNKLVWCCPGYNDCTNGQTMSYPKVSASPAKTQTTSQKDTCRPFGDSTCVVCGQSQGVPTFMKYSECVKVWGFKGDWCCQGNSCISQTPCPPK